MGLFGALFAGVSGLDSQSNKIGIISNNIANVNTVGFKQGSAAFDTLVVPSGTTTFSPGGVIGDTQQLVDQQGLVSASSSATDIAITGNGFFAVSSAATGGSLLYTRAGSFTQDASGDFVNANGYYLQGIPVTTPPTSINTSTLTTVTVNQGASGTATATGNVVVSGNFQATQAVLLGSGITASMLRSNGTSATNAGIAGTAIIAGDDLDNTVTSNGLKRGAQLTITTGGNTPDVFTYGGYSIGRNVTTGSVGDGGDVLATPLTIAAGDMQVFDTTDTANTTTSAITGINVPDTGVTAATGTGVFQGGQSFTIDGTTVAVGATDTLATIAANIEAAVSGATATISGAPGNYTLTVVDPNTGTGTGFAGAGVAGNSPTFTLTTPLPSPQGNQMTITVGGAETANIATGNVANYQVGQYVDISGGTTIGNINPNGEFQIVSVDAANGTVTVNTGQTETTGDASSTTTAVISNRTDTAFTGNILNATTDTADFLSSGSDPLSTSDFSPQAVKFSITVGANAAQTFTYSATPNVADGTFNNLNTLAAAINDAQGLTARVVNGRLYVGAQDPSQSVTYTNGDAAGTGGLPGINWVQELDLPATQLTDINAAPPATTHMFNSISSLAQAINNVDPTNLTASVSNPAAAATLTIDGANPEQTINFTDNTGTSSPATGSILEELGVAGITTVSGPGSNETTNTLPVTYNPASSATDMSSGAVVPQFSHDITVFDAQGVSHTLQLDAVKIGTNTWGVELVAVPASDITQVTPGLNTNGTDGQVASGTLTFNGSGELTGVTGTIATGTGIPVTWTNGAAQSTIVVNLGLNTTTGLTQSSANFNASYTQDGSPIGQLTGVSIDATGFVVETFSNGQTKQVFQVPLANFNDPNGLVGVSGDAYQESLASGTVQLGASGQNGTGQITPSALEQSNVDLSTQLTNLIVAQQAYGANSKVLTIADQLLQQLDQIIQ